jgi:hypothetical protein
VLVDLAKDARNDEGDLEEVKFLASFPPIQSAIKIDGQGGARIQLDIPEIEMGNFIRAMMWRGKRLTITLTLFDESEENEAREEPKRRITKVGRGRS